MNMSKKCTRLYLIQLIQNNCHIYEFVIFAVVVVVVVDFVSPSPT